MIAAGIMGFLTVADVIACTSLAVTDTSGNVYHGRTMEFSGQAPGTLTYFPVGTRIDSESPANKSGMSFKTQYAMLGITGQLVKTSKQPMIIDGANDQGLSISANAFLNSSLLSNYADDSKMLSANDFGAWVLGNFKNINEVKVAILNGDTEFWLPKIPMLGNLPMPMHYAIHDRQGGAIVVEFIDGKKNVYDNPVNALANGPEFPWHIANLKNYTFNNVDKNAGQLGKLKIETVDSGIALTGLPSAQTSQGRFVKAAFYANYVRKGKTPDEAILLLGHIMNNFDRPDQLSVDGAGGMGDGPRTKALSSEATNYSIMKDLSRNRTYFRSVNALNWTVVDMNTLKGLQEVKFRSVYDIDKINADALPSVVF